MNDRDKIRTQGICALKPLYFIVLHLFYLPFSAKEDESKAQLQVWHHLPLGTHSLLPVTFCLFDPLIFFTTLWTLSRNSPTYKSYASFQTERYATIKAYNFLSHDFPGFL